VYNFAFLTQAKIYLADSFLLGNRWWCWVLST